MAIQTVVSSQVSDNVILTIRQAKTNSMTKNLDKKLLKTGYASVKSISKMDVLDYCHQRQNYLIEAPYQCDQSLYAIFFPRDKGTVQLN